MSEACPDCGQIHDEPSEKERQDQFKLQQEILIVSDRHGDEMAEIIGVLNKIPDPYDRLSLLTATLHCVLLAQGQPEELFNQMFDALLAAVQPDPLVRLAMQGHGARA